MESLSGVRVQMEDNEVSQLSPECLRIPLTLRQILEHCSNSELLQLSLVNKQWNYEARSVIKDRGTVIARLDRQQPFEDLALFASHVQQMNIVPYSGISIHFDHDEDESLRWAEALQSSSDVFRNKLPMKHLTVSYHSHWERYYEDCPPFLWVQEILQDHCWVLESVNVGVPSDFEEFNCQNSPHFKFPRLKKLKVTGFCFQPLSRSKTTFIKTMVSRAPNLQELVLDSPVTADDYRALLEGSSAVLVVDGEEDPLNRTLPRSTIGTLRLRRMRLKYYTSWDFSMDRFNRIVPIVLQTSRTTLQELSLDFVFAPNLMRYGIRLENVTQLKMRMDGQLELYYPQHEAADVTAFLRMLQDLDFTHIFPKLIEVEISNSITRQSAVRPEISQFFDQGNVILQEPKPDRAVNIKHLKYLDHGLYSMNVPFLASIFPDIETLSIENCSAAPPFGLICEHWVHLKQLVVHTQGVRGQNWDSVVCGLFPEEIAQLREEDEEYLKAVNIVPVMPSITCMKELKTLTVSNKTNILRHGENDPTYIFSKVTGLIAFSRCPNLSVTLQASSNCENGWSHMKKYASIVVIDSPKTAITKRPRPQRMFSYWRWRVLISVAVLCVNGCCYEFCSRDLLNVHAEGLHERVGGSKKKYYECSICGNEFSTQQTLMRQTRTHTIERPFKREISGCAMALNQESYLKSHIIKYKHSDERSFKCGSPGCLHASKSTSNLILKHQKVHSEERPFPCPHSGCSFRAKRKQDLLRHANIHSESHSFTCSQCYFKTRTSRNLTRHVMVHDGRNENISCSIEGCEYKLKNSRGLKDHMRRHRIRLPCPASGCGEYITTKEALEEHFKLHKPSDRAFRCRLCLRNYKMLDDLQSHCVVHSNEKPFQCGHCEFVAASQPDVKRHISSAHAAIEYPFIVHLLDGWKCIRYKMTLPSAEFVVHCIHHADLDVVT